MLLLPPSVRVYIAAQPIDLRKSFDGLSAAVTARFGQDPLKGGPHVRLLESARQSDAHSVLGPDGLRHHW
jgi:hypothetical protein